LADLGVQYFSDAFKEPKRANIREIIRVVDYFPRMVDEEDNENMYKTILMEELLVVLNTFQKGKSPDLDGWTTEFYLDLFHLNGEDLLRVVEEVRLSRKVTRSINSTFISLIPKSTCSKSFNDFRPISLCNCVYKIIYKIIVIRHKLILSRFISPV